MGGTCTSERNNEGSGCSINGTVIPNTYSSSIDPAVCRSVFAYGPRNDVNALTHLGKCPACCMHCKVWDRQGLLAGIMLERAAHIPTTSSVRSLLTFPTFPRPAGDGRSDSGSLCARSSLAFVFLLNNCNETDTAVNFDLKFNVETQGDCPTPLAELPWYFRLPMYFFLTIAVAAIPLILLAVGVTVWEGNAK